MLQVRWLQFIIFAGSNDINKKYFSDLLENSELSFCPYPAVYQPMSNGPFCSYILNARISLVPISLMLLLRDGGAHRPCQLFDSRIIRRMICESMLSTKMQRLLQRCCLGEPDCLAGIMLFFNKLAHNMQVRPVVSCFNSLMYDKLVVWQLRWYDRDL